MRNLVCEKYIIISHVCGTKLLHSFRRIIYNVLIAFSPKSPTKKNTPSMNFTRCPSCLISIMAPKVFEPLNFLSNFLAPSLKTFNYYNNTRIIHGFRVNVNEILSGSRTYNEIIPSGSKNCIFFIEHK